jgi:hypothetical protein
MTVSYFFYPSTRIGLNLGELGGKRGKFIPEKMCLQPCRFTGGFNRDSTCTAKKAVVKKYNISTFFRTQQELSVMINQVSSFAQRLEKFSNAKGQKCL